jgi:hypothetical protein
MTTQIPTPASLTNTDHYRSVRGRIVVEGSLRGRRISWLVASQAFVFSVYAIALKAPPVFAAAAYALRRRALYQLIPRGGDRVPRSDLSRGIGRGPGPVQPAWVSGTGDVRGAIGGVTRY